MVFRRMSIDYFNNKNNNKASNLIKKHVLICIGRKLDNFWIIGSTKKVDKNMY